MAVRLPKLCRNPISAHTYPCQDPGPPGPPDGDSAGYAGPVEYGIDSLTVGIIIGVAATLLAAGLVYAGIMLGRRSRS